MKSLESIEFNRDTFDTELEAFRELLDTKGDLAERRDVLTFFREHRQLAVSLGLTNPDILRFDRLAFEFPLFGEYTCDFVVGDSLTHHYCFVEFEDASPHSVFKKKRGKTNADWSDRLNRGFSQIIDWFMVLEGQRRSALHKARFGTDVIHFNGLLVIGRDADLDDVHRDRLAWRSQNVLVGGKHVYCLTFDRLFAFLNAKVKLIGGP
jgi:hypothetical protein